METLQKNIRYYRTKAGYTQKELANLLKTSKNSVSNWENGFNLPPIDAIIQMSRIFGLSIDKLITGKETRQGIVQKRSKNLFVPVRAQASYMTSWDDEEMKQNLEPVRIPGIPDDVEARTFEVGGTSMYPLINEGDLLVCLRHEANETFYHDQVFVFITKHSGILVKFIGAENDHAYKLVSHNSFDFRPIVLEKEDIREMWKAKYKITRHFSSGNGATDDHELKTRIERLEDIIRDRLG